MGNEGRLISIDRDKTMLARAAEKLSDPRVSLRQGSYVTMREILDDLGIDRVDGVLVDLGYSSDQIADEQRGFGFASTGPLDMRFDSSNGEPAGELLNSLDQKSIEHILSEFGEERLSRTIAEAIVEQRRQDSVWTAVRLAQLVENVYRRTGMNPSGSHVATQTFQAIRIYVNSELSHVEELLTKTAPSCLKTGGRMVVITFHSLEDRLVKQCFKGNSFWQEATKKPIEPRPTEVRFNPRSRSAKLRVAVYHPTTP